MSIESSIERDKNRPTNQIFVLDDFISDDNCETIVRYINEHELVDEGEYNHETNVNAKVMPPEQKIKSNIHELIVQGIHKIKEILITNYGIEIEGCEYNQLRKIYGSTKYHEDGNYQEGTTRVLSMITALNSDYDGGELVFPCQNFTIKLKRGQCILFPPYWTHPHYTNDLKNNTFRYTINTWLIKRLMKNRPLRAER
jgi:predicted 2-oxoglutarate/Fe(II)-dependent dioxygenase YbiX